MSTYTSACFSLVLITALLGEVDPSKDIEAVPEGTFTNAIGMVMIKLSTGLYVAKYETRQSEFETIMGHNPSIAKDPDVPVSSVTGDEALDFCRRLTEHEQAKGRLPEGYTYTLPSFNEWLQYVADAPLSGSVTPDGQPGMNARHALRVGRGEVNRLGICDLRGNVSEYSRDRYNTGSQGIVGASWNSHRKDFLRVRNWAGFMEREDKSIDVGFRCVLVREQVLQKGTATTEVALASRASGPSTRKSAQTRPAAASRPWRVPASAQVDPQALELIRHMAGLLSRTPNFQMKVACEISSDDPTSKVDWRSTYSVKVRRPNRFAILLADGPMLASSYASDGETLTVYSPSFGTYETVQAPATLADLLSKDYVTAATGPGWLEEPFYWVLVPNADEALLASELAEPLDRLEYLGVVSLYGRECHQLKLTYPYRQELLWIQTGAKPLPERLEQRRFDDKPKPGAKVKAVIIVSFDEWAMDVRNPDSDFRLRIPPSARPSRSGPSTE